MKIRTSFFLIALLLSAAVTPLWGQQANGLSSGGGFPPAIPLPLLSGDCLSNNGTTLSWGACGSGSGIVTSFVFTNGNGFTGTVTNATNTLTGSSALANPFSSPYPPTTYDGKQFQIWATVSNTTPSHPVLSGGKVLVSNGHIVTGALMFMTLRWIMDRRDKLARERKAAGIVIPNQGKISDR